MYNIGKVKAVLRDMRALKGQHKVVIIHTVFGVKMGRSLKYRAASKFYDWAQRHEYI